MRNVARLFDPYDQVYAGSSLRATYRHRVRLFSASGGLSVQFIFANWKNCPDSITGLSTIFVAAAVEIGGTVTPLTFGGSAEVSIAPGATATSDAITLTTSDYIYVRTRPRVASSGQKWPIGLVMGGASFGNEGVTDNADLTTTGSASVGVSVGYGFGPYQIIANTNTLASIFVEGDSIAYGQGDNNSGYSGDTYFDKGWIARVVNLARPTKYNAKSGTTAAQHATNTYTNGEYDQHTYLLCELGVNDLASSLATIKASLSTIYATAKAAGLRVAQTTITPDGNAGHEANRTALNAWIRAKTDTNIDYVVEVADVVETARDSGTWKTNYSSDNVHPSPTGHAAIATAVGTALMADIALADNLPTYESVTITNGATAEVSGEDTLQLAATVQGTNSPSQTVTWSIVSGSGTVNGSTGLFTAPGAGQSDKTTVVKATAADGTTYDTISITTPAAGSGGGTTEVITAYMGPLRASIGGTFGSAALVLVVGEDKGVLISIVDHAGNPFSLSGLTDDDLTAEVHNAAGTLLLSPTVAIESDLGGLVLLTGWSDLTDTAQRDLFLTIKIDGGTGNVHITEPAFTQVLAR